MTDLPDLKLKALVTYPATVNGGTGIDVTKANGAVTVNLAYDEFGTSTSLPVSSTSTFLVYDTAINSYVRMPASLFGGGVSGIADAPVDGVRYERLSGAWSADPIQADAPNNGSQYARQNAGWAVVSGNNFTQAGTGAVTRTMQDKARDIVHVRDFGAACNGTTDDTAAIQAALNTGHIVRLPDGSDGGSICKITGTLTIGVSGGGLIGGGRLSSTLTSSSTTAPMISIPDAIDHVTIAGMRLTRSVTASSGADGIVFVGNTQISTLSDLWVDNQFNGLLLRTTANSLAENIITNRNQGDGLRLQNTATAVGLQWSLIGIHSELNGGRGFLIASIPTVPIVGNSVSTMARLSSFANTLEGFLVAGISSVPINGLRLYSSFFGEDGGDEVSLDTWGGLHVINGVFAELAGTRTTGPAVSTPASHLGNGFNFSPNNQDIQLIGAHCSAHSQRGLVSSAATLEILGGSFIGNGVNGTLAPGISIQAGNAVRIMGVRSGNATGSTQSYGLAVVAGVTNLMAIGNDLTGNTTGAVSNASVAITNVFRDNSGFNPQGMSTITVGASPFAYRAGPTQENVFIIGGTITGMNINAVSIGITNSVTLGPNQQLGVAYSVIPTMVANRQ